MESDNNVTGESSAAIDSAEVKELEIPPYWYKCTVNGSFDVADAKQVARKHHVGEIIVNGPGKMVFIQYEREGIWYKYFNAYLRKLHRENPELEFAFERIPLVEAIDLIAETAQAIGSWVRSLLKRTKTEQKE